MLDDFLTRAMLAGLGTALAAAPLGCFVVWRRMAYFSDATSHSAILGIAFALAFNVSPAFGALATAFLMALAIGSLTGRRLTGDTALGVLAHGALAAGLVAAALLPIPAISLESLLFGDILTVSRTDLAVIWGGAVVILALLAARWTALLTATLDPDLARASGIDPDRTELVLTVTLALTVAIAIEVVGVLLIGALLVIPAAAARPLARTPEAMAGIAAVIGAASALGGLQIAAWQDTPAGPTIVCTALALFALSRVKMTLT
ncbi:metal ABC transporter permease [Aestuariibius sp. 2305UL40-4]|uniref:metal ABC transporter permease n=1 Tax=Aestuariibius violaceus TaxID=3234132 RepID=UPI00345E0BB7